MVTYPESVILDKTVEDIEDVIEHLKKERHMNDDMLEFALYKVLANVQRRKMKLYANEFIGRTNRIRDLEKELDALKLKEREEGDTNE